MRFSNVDPRESQIGFFVLTNEGGPYTNIRIDDPDLPWLTVTGVASLGTDEELPLQVQVEATGEKWEQIYTATIAAWLDGVATAVRVELRTKPEPVATTATTRSPPSTTGTRSAASTVSGPSSTSAPTVGAASVGSRPTGTARPAPSAAPVRDTSGILVSWGVWLAPMALLGVVGVAVLGSDSLALWLWFTPLLVLTSLTLGALGWLGVYWLIEQGDYGWLYRHQDVVAVTSAAVTALVCLGAGLWWHTAITNAIASLALASFHQLGGFPCGQRWSWLGDLPASRRSALLQDQTLARPSLSPPCLGYGLRCICATFGVGILVAL